MIYLLFLLYHAVVLTNWTQHDITADIIGFVTRHPITVESITLLALLGVRKTKKSQKVAQNADLCPPYSDKSLCVFLHYLLGWL